MPKENSPSNKSKIHKSNVDIGEDYVVGGKGNRNYYFNFSAWGSVLIFLIVFVILLTMLIFRPQWFSTAPRVQEDTLITPPPDTVSVQTDTAPAVALPKPSASQPSNDPVPRQKTIGTAVKIAVEATDPALRSIAESILTDHLLAEGMKVMNKHPNADYVLKCWVQSQIDIKETKRTIYLPEFTVDLRMMRLPNEEIQRQLSLSSASEGFHKILAKENEISGAFREWFSKSLRNKTLR